MLAILFGLSMDYQVFLVSRMHEEWVHSRDNHRAIRVGQAETGRLINAAALIMICVFIAFVFGGQRVIAEYGVGLAAAVAIDAFVLRTVLVPALMHLLGPANWWLPGWLDRILPRFSIEGSSAPAPVVGSPIARVSTTRRVRPVGPAGPPSHYPLRKRRALRRGGQNGRGRIRLVVRLRLVRRPPLLPRPDRLGSAVPVHGRPRRIGLAR